MRRVGVLPHDRRAFGHRRFEDLRIHARLPQTRVDAINFVGRARDALERITETAAKRASLISWKMEGSASWPTSDREMGDGEFADEARKHGSRQLLVRSSYATRRDPLASRARLFCNPMTAYLCKRRDWRCPPLHVDFFRYCNRWIYRIGRSPKNEALTYRSLKEMPST